MTTVVVDRKLRMMAADRMLVCGGNQRSKYQKIVRLDDVLIGFAGGAEEGVAFECWYEDQQRLQRGEPTENPDDKDAHYPRSDAFHALVLHKTGQLSWYGKAGYPVNITDRYFGIGSGSDFALGALYAGADLRTAILVAEKLDTNSGLGVQLEGFKNA